MKPIIPATLVIMLCLAACRSGEDIIDEPDTRLLPVRIGGGQQADMSAVTNGTSRSVAPASRAAAHPLEEDFQSFKLWGYKTTGYANNQFTNHQNVMDQYIVQWNAGTAGTTESNVADWEYVGIPNEHAAGTDSEGNPNLQTVKYWDFAATSYRYFAFAPHDETKVEYGESGDNQPYADTHGNWWYNISFEADATNPYIAPLISKLWFSNNAVPNPKYGETVTLEFLKPVTKVRIRLIDKNGKTIVNPFEDAGFGELEFKPADGTSGIVQSGKLKVSYALTGPTTVANYLPQVKIVGTDVGTVHINKTDDTYSQWYYVLPHVEQGDFQLVGLIGSDRRIGTVPHEYMSWFPNVEYTYIFKMTETDFQFIDIVQIGVTEWQPEGSTHDIYNW